ncbi:MAG: NAD(P)/FAD-dependent oxidoreductase [Alphaproteobacteria bacterium]|nr:NAD(P)/FAD-dependent oxidoreductase [Alphaproteobacteria bacterium]
MGSESSSERLRNLEARVRHELDLLNHPKGKWVPAREHASGRPVFDVLVVGAGQSGLGTLSALSRENVTNTLAVDRNPAGREGPWKTFARMRLLRTHKDITGPALGVPSLTPRAWYTAKYGEEAWHALVRIPRTDWQDYLDWYRRVVDLPVWNDTEVGPLAADEPDNPDSLIRVPLTATREGGRTETVYAREVVLANGLEGCGVWYIPEMITENLPPDRYAQANSEIDFNRLRGRRVVVVGANAGGFDAANAALEAGAASADLLVRRARLPRVNAHKPIDSVAWLKHFGDLDDATRWRLMVHIMRNNQPPPQDTFDLARSFPGFTMHEGAAMTSVRLDGDTVIVETASGTAIEADFVIAATGFKHDFHARVETSGIADAIALWSDCYTPPKGEDWAPMGTYPYLGASFEFTEKSPGSAPWLHHIHCFSLGTKPSLGLTGSSATSMRYGVPRLVQALTRQLFLDDADHHVDALLSFDEEDLVVRGSPEAAG